jgi:hypothetical protein
VIAIENVRLFDEIRDKSRQLAEASQHKSQFLANMSHAPRAECRASKFRHGSMYCEGCVNVGTPLCTRSFVSPLWL